MSLKNWSTTAASNTSAPPDGAPEGSTLLGDVSNIIRQNMADTRTLAAADTIAAAGTTDIGTKDATFLTLTGTATTITALGTVSPGIYKVIIYNAAHSLTYNATSLILVGNANRTVAAGDVSLFISEGSGNWRELMYMPDGGYVTAATVAAGYQPLNADLTAIAALTTAAFGRGMLEYADAATAFAALKQDASESATGVVELATSAETAALTDPGRVIVPANLEAGVKAAANAAGSAPIYACRAWINFNGITGVARAAGNATVAKTGTGRYTITLTEPLEDADYCYTSNVDVSIANLTNAIPYVNEVSRLAGELQIRTNDSNGAAIDSEVINLAFFR